MPPLIVAVVADDHAFAALDAADAGDQAGAMDVVVIHAVGGERRQFEERRAGIEQPHDAVARQQLAARHVALADARRAAGRRFGAARLQFIGKRAHARGVGGKLRRAGVDIGCDRQPNPSRAQLYALHKADVNGPSEWNQNESSEKSERIVARNVAMPDR